MPVSLKQATNVTKISQTNRQVAAYTELCFATSSIRYVTMSLRTVLCFAVEVSDSGVLAQITFSLSKNDCNIYFQVAAIILRVIILANMS